MSIATKLGANNLPSLCCGLEQIRQSGDVALARPLLVEMRLEHTRVVDELEQVLQEAG